MIDHAPWRGLPEIEPALVEAGHAALDHAALGHAAGEQLKHGEVSISLCSDDVMRDLNRRYRGKDSPTNVLSFSVDDPLREAPGPVLLGDVVLGYETVMAEARNQNKPAIDHARHLVVHGVLHLFGMDHETESDAKTMERMEVAILTRLGIPDPYQLRPADERPVLAPTDIRPDNAVGFGDGS